MLSTQSRIFDMDGKEIDISKYITREMREDVFDDAVKGIIQSFPGQEYQGEYDKFFNKMYESFQCAEADSFPT